MIERAVVSSRSSFRVFLLAVRTPFSHLVLRCVCVNAVGRTITDGIIGICCFLVHKGNGSVNFVRLGAWCDFCCLLHICICLRNGITFFLGVGLSGEMMLGSANCCLIRCKFSGFSGVRSIAVSVSMNRSLSMVISSSSSSFSLSDDANNSSFNFSMRRCRVSLSLSSAPHQ